MGPLELWSEGRDSVPHYPGGSLAPFYPWGWGWLGRKHTALLARTYMLAHTCAPCLPGPTSHPAAVHTQLTSLWFPGPKSIG